MKSDKEFLDGIYEKVKEHELENKSEMIHNPSGFRWYKQIKYAPVAACIILLIIFIPSYYAWRGMDETEPEIAPLSTDLAMEQPELEERGGRILLPEGDAQIDSFSLPNDTESVSPTTENETFSMGALDSVEGRKIITEVRIMAQSNIENKYYVLAETKDNIAGSVKPYIMLEYEVGESGNDLYNFKEDEISILYLMPISAEPDASLVQFYTDIFNQLFSNYEVDEVNNLEFYRPLGNKYGRYIYKETINEVAIYESEYGVQITKEELRQYPNRLPK